MEWFKRASGLKLFLAIWLLIFIIPICRLRATRQWQDDQLIAMNWGRNAVPGIELGLTDSGVAKLVRRFPNDPAVQLKALKRPDVWNSAPWFSNTQPLTVAESNRATEKYFKDLRQANDKYFANFAELARRFPDALYIRSQWLRNATGGALLVESPELLKSYSSPKSPGNAGNQSSLQPTSWMTDARLAEAVECARAGGKLEPDNAYWPWMEAIFAFSLRREDEALLALKRAGKCSRFNDGAMDSVGRNIELMRRVQLCDTEDEFAEFWNVLFPHLARLRGATRQAMWDAHLAYQRGDHTRALEITDIVQQAALPIARTKRYFIARLVGEAMMSIAWKEMLKSTGRDMPEFSDYSDSAPNKRIQYRQDMAVALTHYAQQQGRSDIGKRTMYAATILNAQFDLVTPELLAAKPKAVLLDQRANQLMTFHWLGSWLLRLSFCGGVLWLLGALATRYVATDLELKRKRGMVITSAFCIGVTAALLWFAATHDTIPRLNLYTLNGENPSVNESLRQGLPFFLALIWLVPIQLLNLANQLCARWRLKAITKSNFWLTTLTVLTIFGFYIVGMALTLPLEDTVTGQFWPLPILLFETCFLATAYLYVRHTRPTLKWSVALCWCAVACWIAWLLLNATSRDGEASLAFFTVANSVISLTGLAAIILLAASIIFWARNGGPQGALQSELLAHMLVHTRLAAATLAICGSLAYVGAALSEIPVRHQTHQALERQLQIGEVALVEEQLGVSTRR